MADPQHGLGRLLPGGFVPREFGGQGGGVRPGANASGGSGPGSETDLVSRADEIEAEEQRRQREGVGVVRGAFEESRRTLADLVDPNLLFSQASDAVGARSKRSLEGLRKSLGARGLNPNSGAAQGLLSRLISSQEGQLVGAKRDIALDNQRQRQVNAATNFANALNLSQEINRPVSAVGLDTATNIFEGRIAREGIAAQRASADKASSDNKLGSLGGGALSLVGSAFGK